MRAGTISINSNDSIHTEAPFGGYKMSGIGRELGMHALDLYTEVKNVFVDLLARRPESTDLASVEQLLPEWRALAATSARSALDAPDWLLPLARRYLGRYGVRFLTWRDATASWSAWRP